MSKSLGSIHIGKFFGSLYLVFASVSCSSESGDFEQELHNFQVLTFAEEEIVVFTASVPDEEAASVPDEEAASVPDEGAAGVPDEESADGPDEESADGPDEESADGPDEESADGPDEESADGPDEESADGPDEESADGPDEESADGPDEESADGPDEESPDTNYCYQSDGEYTAALNEIQYLADQLIDATWVSESGKDVNAAYFRFPGYYGLLDLYTATSESKYIQVAIDMSLNYIEAGSYIDSDEYLDWHSPWVANLDYINHWHYEWRAAAGIALTAGYIAIHPELSRYSDELDKMVTYLEKHVWEKWVESTELNYIHSNRAHKITYLLGRLGTIAIGLHEATGDTKYFDYITNRGRELVNSLIYQTATDSYNLTCWLDGTDCDVNIPGTSDVSHANDAVSFLVEAYISGYDILSLKDMLRLSNSVTNVFWSQDSINDWVNGQGLTTGLGRNNSGWAKLSRYSSELYEKYIPWALSASPEGLTAFERVGTLGGLARITAELEHNVSAEVSKYYSLNHNCN